MCFPRTAEEETKDKTSWEDTEEENTNTTQGIAETIEAAEARMVGFESID